MSIFGGVTLKFTNILSTRIPWSPTRVILSSHNIWQHLEIFFLLTIRAARKAKLAQVLTLSSHQTDLPTSQQESTAAAPNRKQPGVPLRILQASYNPRSSQPTTESSSFKRSTVLLLRAAICLFVLICMALWFSV